VGHFLPGIVLLNVRWYCRYALNYRDLEEMMAERGIKVDHPTINRWVLKYGLNWTNAFVLISNPLMIAGELMNAKRDATVAERFWRKTLMLPILRLYGLSMSIKMLRILLPLMHSKLISSYPKAHNCGR